jgi:hypothetical protein
MSWFYRPQYYRRPRYQAVRYPNGRKTVTRRGRPGNWTRTTIHPHGRKAVTRATTTSPLALGVGIVFWIVFLTVAMGAWSIPIYAAAAFLFVRWLKTRKRRTTSGPTAKTARSTVPLRTRAPTVRVSDADRELVIGALREHHIAERLTLNEFEERVGRAYSATTFADLKRLTLDLPEVSDLVSTSLQTARSMHAPPNWAPVTTLQAALLTDNSPDRPPSASLTVRNSQLHYAEAYEKTAEELRQMLSKVTNHESAQSFVKEAGRQLKAAEAATPEFYTGEFYNRFQKEMRDEAKAEIARCERETEQIASAAKSAEVDLYARIAVARTAGDQDAEHSIWVEGEQRKADHQAAIDALTNRPNIGIWRLRAVDDLGVALGGQRNPTHERPQVATTANDESRQRNGGDSGMGPIETAVRNSVTAGDVLSTPTGRGQFIVADVGAKGPILLLGPKQTRTLIPWAALEGVPGLLGAEGWTVIGSVFDQAADPTTLDGHMKRFVNRATAGWVACLLEGAGLVQIDRRPPARVRVRPDFSWSTPTKEVPT